ncbi:helix-turn-helix domain-containing protein [Companilactobacillus futsaii]|uniref:HTH cro/C1-type domain-containing protein n=2 Tax=Companilactobacillus futsaii TaxID=938155 RepID=A0A5B7SZ07_9LACO|nr:helix-turn-helix transcriptional regulator [Companilactobacillus futsaii]KRK99330.1 hypothetical protein FC88_GL000450 [Companilactobacillus futsaii JCM 17355]QCX25037.1 hypothetical protein FG051_07890 [Companilactobacillus futsaii]
MLKFNLDKILKDNNENISELSRETGLSRKTLTQLSNNDSKGIQLNTLQKLMEHFDLPVESFFINIDNTYASIIKFDNDKTTIPVDINLDIDKNNLLLLQLVSDENNDNKLYYHSYPIILSFLNGENSAKIFGISIFELLDFNDQQYKALADETKNEVLKELKRINKILSKFSKEQLFVLFATALDLVSPDTDLYEESLKTGSLPFLIDCFGIQEVEFINIKKNKDGYIFELPDDIINSKVENSTHSLSILSNGDLIKLLNIKKSN